MEILVLASFYALILGSFIWARLFYFEREAKSNLLTTLLYDPAVATHVILTFFCLFQPEQISIGIFILAFISLTASLCLFFWTIKSAERSKLAFKDDIHALYTRGAYGLVRHPFYLSYILTWSISSYLFNFWPLHITLGYLVCFYIVSARREERHILESSHSDEYRKYCNKVGMFFPRISK